MKTLALITLALTGCASRFYENGQLTAEIAGDYTYQRTTAGAVSITLKHSPVIRAGGVATTQAIGATGTAASAIILSTP